MDADRRNDTGIFRYTDVEYTPEGHTDAYRWDDFLGIAGGHVYSAMDTIDMVSTGGQYEGDEPEHAYACEIVGCCGLSDGVALFRPVSHDGADLIQIAFLRNDVDDATGAYTERFEAGSFDLPAADLPRSEFGVDLLEYFSGRSFKYTPGVSRGLDPREAVDSIEDAIGCDLGLFDGFWLGVPGEADMRVGPYTKKSLLDFSYYAKELSCRYGFADSDILEIARHLPDECPDCLAAVKAYLDCEYVSDGNAPDEKTYRWGDFLEIAGGDARYAAMLAELFAACQVQLAFIQADFVLQALDCAKPTTDKMHFESVYTSHPFSRRYILACCLGAFTHPRFAVAREAVADIEKRSNAKNSPTNIVAAAKKAASANVSADGAGSGKHI